METLLTFDWAVGEVIFTKLAVAFVLALPVALEREHDTRLMGLRTFPIVAMATCGYVLMTTSFAAGNDQAQARVVQGLITGMGFIGGGAILKGDGGVRGTATAASLWATGAIGAAVAFGRLEIALTLSLALFLALRFLTPMKDEVGSRGERNGADGEDDG